MTIDLDKYPKVPALNRISPLQNNNELAAAINKLCEMAYSNSYAHGFYDLEEGEQVNLGEKIALMHSELSEVLEVMRKDPTKESEKIPGFLQIEEEFADTIIRIADTCGARGWNLGGAIIAKHTYNVERPYKHGKKF